MTEIVAPESGHRRRQAKAVLAAGLVLGVGAVATLAAWNDSEYATGTFTAGSFNVQGSTTSATAGFTDHATSAGAAALTFNGNFANLAPAESTYASMWVRLAPGTTAPGALSLSSLAFVDVTGTNSTQLSWSATQIAAGATCDATATGTVLGSGTDLTANTAPAASVTLTPGATSAEAGAPIQICFRVTGKDALQQGGQTTATWQFTGTSA